MSKKIQKSRGKAPYSFEQGGPPKTRFLLHRAKTGLPTCAKAKRSIGFCKFTLIRPTLPLDRVSSADPSGFFGCRWSPGLPAPALCWHPRPFLPGAWRNPGSPQRRGPRRTRARRPGGMLARYSELARYHPLQPPSIIKVIYRFLVLIVLGY